MNYFRESIRESWEWVLRVTGVTSPAEMDEAARRVIRVEIESLNERRIRLEKLLAEPERLRNRKIAEQMAEEMHQKLQEKRRNPKPLTPEEQLAYDVWKASLTPREKCTHRKGATATRFGVDKYGGPHHGGVIKDYNVGDHTFNDGSRKIWCLIGCGFVSWEGDEKWAEALKMSEDSTNRPSSSERPVVE